MSIFRARSSNFRNMHNAAEYFSVDLNGRSHLNKLGCYISQKCYYLVIYYPAIYFMCVIKYAQLMYIKYRKCVQINVMQQFF